VSENRFLHQFCALLGASILVCGTHLFLLATWNSDSATDVEAAPPATAIISIDVSDRSSPGPVAGLEIAPAPVSVELATKDQIADSESVAQVIPPSPVEQPDASSEAPQFTASTEEQAQVALEDRPRITAEARVGDRTPLASASVNLLVAVEEPPRIIGEASVHQTPVASTSANLFVASKEQPRITAEARPGDQTPLASANASRGGNKG
jgi:hypothetical protein